MLQFVGQNREIWQYCLYHFIIRHLSDTPSTNFRLNMAFSVIKFKNCKTLAQDKTFFLQDKTFFARLLQDKTHLNFLSRLQDKSKTYPCKTRNLVSCNTKNLVKISLFFFKLQSFKFLLLKTF